MMDNTATRSDYYVYLFRNPMDNNIFYIGHGSGNRAEQLKNRNQETTTMIEKIREEFGKTKRPIEDIIEILRDNIDQETAQKIEGAAIDLIGLPNLTNQIGGKGTTRWKERQKKKFPRGFIHGRASDIREIIDPKEEADITEPVILIRINQLYRYGMDAASLYDATRGIWVIGPRRECAEYAFSVFKGIVMEVYKIKHPWHQAGKQETFYETRPDCNELFEIDPPRWEFEGEVAEKEIREKYLKKSVKRYLSNGSQNPIKYVNCES
jgi:hypothetical protein